MNKKNKKSAATVIEIILIAALTATLIYMFATYCSLKNSFSYSSLPDLPLDNGGFSDIRPEEDGSNKPYIFPSCIGISGEDGHFYSPGFGNERNEISEKLLPIAARVLSENCEKASFANDYEKMLFRDSLYRRKNCLYLAFASPVPAASFAPCVSDRLDPSVLAFSVGEMFLYNDKGQYSCTVIADDKEIYTFRPSDDYAVETTVSELLSSEYKLNGLCFENIGGRYFPLFSDSVAINRLSPYTNSGDFLTKGSHDAEKLLLSFGYNPNNIRSYSSNDSITYVEQHGELNIDSLGNTVYSGTGGGIDISELSEKHGISRSFSEKIRVCCDILSSLDKGIFGGECDFSLCGATFADGKLSVFFSYVCRGITIDGTEGKTYFVFEDDRLVSAYIKSFSAVILGSTSSDIPQKLLFGLSSEQNAGAQSFLPRYMISQNDEKYSAKFVFGISDSITVPEETEVDE